MFRPTEKACFIEQLNSKTNPQGFDITFRTHHPKTDDGTPNAKLAYGFVYIRTESIAKEVTQWLQTLNIHSELLYVKSKDHYLVKIPNINRFHRDFFKRDLMPAELSAVLRLISQTKQQSQQHVQPHFERLEVIGCQLWSNRQEYITIRANDVKQTSTLSSVPVQLTDSFSRNFFTKNSGNIDVLTKYLKYVHDHVVNIDQEFTVLQQALFRAAIDLRRTDKSMLPFVKQRSTTFDMLSKLLISPIETYVNMSTVRNNLYKLWLFNIQQSHQSDQQKDEQAIAQWQQLRSGCGQELDEIEEFMSKMSITMDENFSDYLRNILCYETGMLKDEPLKEQLKPIRQQVVTAHNTHCELIEKRRGQYGELKTRASELAKKCFRESYKTQGQDTFKTADMKG